MKRQFEVGDILKPKNDTTAEMVMVSFVRDNYYTLRSYPGDVGFSNDAAEWVEREYVLYRSGAVVRKVRKALGL